MAFFLETRYEIFEIEDTNFDPHVKQLLLKRIHQSFDTMGKANVWIIENGLSDVKYTILEIIHRKRN